jgi:hypothetical protein
MTKTTNYEISKKLAEIGFRAQCSYFYFHSDNNDCEASSLEKYGFDKINECDIEDEYYPAYDLETLLNALPSKIKGIEGECWFNIHFRMNKDGLWYENLCNCDSDQSCPVESYCHIEIKNNESLADTAGRMLILLHEKNLIKF